MQWTPELRADLEARWHRGDGKAKIRRDMGLTVGQLAGRITVWNLHSAPGTRANFNQNNPAVLEGRTRFPSMVTDEGAALKPGSHSQKIGKRVTKGAWKGFPIFMLTLEERKTCPQDCAVWSLCYGDHMHFAKRMQHGRDLERKIWHELTVLQKRYRRGFVVRLHVLGDFYSVGYVDFWREAIDAFPALHVFGYTARQATSRIGRTLAALRDEQWERFAVRTSGALTGPRTMVINTEADCPPRAIVCPAQTGRTRSCSTCSLCWASKKPVAFLRH